MYLGFGRFWEVLGLKKTGMSQKKIHASKKKK